MFERIGATQQQRPKPNLPGGTQMTHQPLRITATLRTGVISDNYLPLDAILFYQVTRRAYGPQEATTPGAKQQQQQGKPPPMPLDKATINNWWMWTCSFAQWGPHSDGQSFWTKRFDQSLAGLVDFDGKRGKIDSSSGRYKGYNMPIFYRHALYVRWYAYGDLEDIAALLADVTHIGKKVAQGCGRVNAWTVEKWAHNSWLYDDRGKLMRAIPEAGGIFYGIRPSYWSPRHQTECRLP